MKTYHLNFRNTTNKFCGGYYSSVDVAASLERVEFSFCGNVLKSLDKKDLGEFLKTELNLNDLKECVCMDDLSSLEIVMVYSDCVEYLIYRDWETDRKSTRLNSSHSAKSRMPSSA